ncbi:hypothetical protein [Paludibaculum fermentans]|uniref:Cytochrome c domain-containing protein n=1 Tax=Paludibaculum fermentans TaxID=1473598 RepID=A0A7S7NNE8_PALFE|nr:hypothetical protein [Paludibaculum fermentans]QOY86745.1 hypothetical protein IRI77_28760 [Paludibaculum fermentans]
MKSGCAIGFLLISSTRLLAHDPITTPLTWSKEISRILERRCLGCHQPGGKAPFTLTTYEDARPWAVAIREEVSNRTMPPWNAVKGFGTFRNDMALTQEEIQTITDWVNGGAPEGDPKLASGVIPHAYHPEELPRGAVETPAGTFSFTATLMGIRIAAMPKGTEAHLLLHQPDGTRTPLLWIRQFQPAAPRLYLLAEPITAQPGARIVISTAVQPNATVRFLAVVERSKAAPAHARTPAPTGE